MLIPAGVTTIDHQNNDSWPHGSSRFGEIVFVD